MLKIGAILKMLLTRSDFHHKTKFTNQEPPCHHFENRNKITKRQKTRPSLKKVSAILCLIPGLLVSQVSPASAADTSRTYYNGVTAPGLGKAGSKGNIVGGSSSLIVGTKASVSVSTFLPTGAVLHTGSTAGKGPTSIVHSVVISGFSGCVWLESGGQPNPRNFQCSDIHRS